MANTPDKPQGKGSTKNPGGLFVDPLDKWDEEDPNMPGAPELTGKGGKGQTKSAKIKEEVKKALITDVDNAADKIEKLIKKLTKPNLSREQRADINRALVEARRSFLKLTETSNKVSLELKESRRLEAEAYAKLSRLKTWKANGRAGLTKEQEQQLDQTEHMLRNFIKATNIYRQGDNHLNEDVRKEVFNKLDMLVDQMGDLPDYVQDMFKQEDTKIDKLLQQQAEAKDFVKAQNDAMKKFMWKTADRMGYGAFNLGNLIRGGRAIYNLPKNVKAKYNAVADKVKGAHAYVTKTMEMRRLAKSPIVGDDELENVAAGNDPKATEQKKTSDILSRYAAQTEAFRRRLLDKFGKKKDKKPPEEDKSMLDGMMQFFGKGGFIKSLLGVAAKVSAVAIAGAIGYWIGSKIWEKIAPWVGEKFNNLTGLNQAGKEMTRQVIMNTQDNFKRAQSIEQALKTPGTKVSGADKDWFASYQLDNSEQAKDLSKYKPSKAMQAINAKASGGSAPAVAPVSAPAPSASVTLPDTGAGGGRGSVNPPTVTPSSITPVSTGGQISDAIGKSIQLSGNADVEGLHPSMQANLANMANEYYQATGKKLQVNSGFRSQEEQARLFKTMPKGMASSPGSSLHNYGLAVDIQSAQANELQNLGLLQKYGFVRPIPTEKWHMQPAGITVAAAKAGVYSADAPANQGAGGTQVASGKPSSVQVASAEPRIPLQTSDGTPVNAGSGGQVGTISSASKKTASDIPTFDTSDGMLVGMNIGAIAS